MKGKGKKRQDGKSLFFFFFHHLSVCLSLSLSLSLSQLSRRRNSIKTFFLLFSQVCTPSHSGYVRRFLLETIATLSYIVQICQRKVLELLCCAID